MIQNKKGLSDIVTTALIILLVAVAVAAIWAFVSPALRGTGIQFTKTQVCVSNLIEPITCKTMVAGADSVVSVSPSFKTGDMVFPISVQIRRTLTDGVAVPTDFVTVVGTSPDTIKNITTDLGTGPTGAPSETGGPKIPKTQGELVEIITNRTSMSTATTPVAQPGVFAKAGSSPQVQVTTTYRLPDNTIVKCPSLPITCNAG